ncbi:type I restriction enzyme HsdR N-terminal domain-containing protein [Blattabacterium cuenoti]
MKFFNFFIEKKLHINTTKNSSFIYCVIRKKFIIFSKEELIRQYIIFLLKEIKNYKNSNILVEVPIEINKLSKRLDILVLLNNKPHILVECKSPLIPITQKVFDQIAMYNKIVKSPYLMISNGVKNFVYQVNKLKKKFSFLKYIP